MTVQDVMVKPVKVCNPEMTLAAATEMLWADRCGSLPVVDIRGNVIGMITDRDICIALGAGDAVAAYTKIKDIMLPKVFVCMPEDDVHRALETMAAQRVRRLPVLDRKGALKGILSIDDIVLHAEKNGPSLSYEDVMTALQAICAPAGHPGLTGEMAWPDRPVYTY